MFGLVRRSRLIDAEKRVVSLRVDLVRRGNRVDALERELAVQTRLREAAEAERDRLQMILVSHPVEASNDPPAAPKAEPAAPEPIRMLSGLEVVQRATAHRNLRNKEVQSK